MIAPIIIFTYNRLTQLKVVIEHLQNNLFSNESDLFIFSDHAKSEKDIQSVWDVREYLKTISGFKSITIIERFTNCGLAKNIIDGVSEIIEKYETVIVLEDDLITSKNFLCYMNQALDFYEKDERIFAISGYSGNLPSLNDLKGDGYLSYRPSSWGWATWKNEWNQIDWNIADYDTFIKDKNAIKNFNRGGVDLTRMLKHWKLGKNHSWAIRWAYNASKFDKFAFYPRISKVQNIGFGHDATNCKGIDIYDTLIDTSESCDFKFEKNIKLNNQIAKEFAYVFSYTNKVIKRIKSYASRLAK